MVRKQEFANGIASLFSNKKQNGSGGTISEDEFGNYLIDISVTLKFGCELAKVASEIQQNNLISSYINDWINNILVKANYKVKNLEKIYVIYLENQIMNQ